MKKQTSVKRNGILFRGRYGDALLKFENGGEITMYDFYNGKYEPTSKISRFIGLLNLAEINYSKSSDVLRKMSIRRC